MRKGKAIKMAVFFASATIFFSFTSMTAKAEEDIPTEQGVAGIAYYLENYILAVQEENIDADEELTILQTEIISPYANLGVSKAESYVNVRSKPSTESKVVGKLYRGCAADILEYLEGDWVKIKSGDVEGYIASNYLAIGRDAEAMIDKYAEKFATVDTQTLRVREKQSIDSKILTQIPQGETYVVINEYDEWAEILLGTDGNTGKDFTGFVSKDYLIITVKFKYAISIEEENRIIREQQEAERAEAERKELLRQEAIAKKKEEERKAAEAKKAAQAKKDNKPSENSSSSDSSSESSSGSSSGVSSIHNEIVKYARKFIGNPYVWGGNSLTKGADCSGFVQSVYRDFGYSITRVSKDQATSAGKRVSVGERQPGDLIFYSDSRGVVNHVALYIGNDKIVHAASSREGIIESKYNYRNISCVRRIVY